MIILVQVNIIFALPDYSSGVTERHQNLFYGRLINLTLEFDIVSHIQRIGCQPEQTTLHGGQSRSWSAEQGKENKIKSLATYRPPHPPHCSFGENK